MKGTQLTLFPEVKPEIDIYSYDYYIVCFSGGKDSLACILDLLDRGVERNKIELWHHDVDPDENFLDWLPTVSYVKAVANYLELPLYLSWREGGFKGELLRDNEPTKPMIIQTPTGYITTGGNGKKGTRKKFPQQSGNLQTRWCSSYLKIAVGSSGIANQDRFLGKKTLVITGERREESPARAKYLEFEPDRTNCKSRHVDRWRSVIDWNTKQVWNIIKKHRINPFVSYHLGFGRASCAFCIFSLPEDLRVLLEIYPKRFQEIADLEQQFGLTISRDKISIRDRALSKPLRKLDPQWIEQAQNKDWFMPIYAETWQYPAGSFASLKGGSF